MKIHESVSKFHTHTKFEDFYLRFKQQIYNIQLLAPGANSIYQLNWFLSTFYRSVTPIICMLWLVTDLGFQRHGQT